MPVLLVVSRKGGVGKTTTCVHLAEAWAADREVVLIDADGQQQSAQWLSNWAAIHQVSPGTRRLPSSLSIVGIPDGRTANIRKVISGGGLVIIDSPGGASVEMVRRRGGLYELADAVLIPSAASIADAAEVVPTAREVAALAPHLPAAVALVGVRARAEATVSEIREALERKSLVVLASQVRDSAQIERSFGRPTSLVGREQYAPLAAELLGSLGW